MKSTCRITGKIVDKFIVNNLCKIKTNLKNNFYESKIVWIEGTFDDNILQVKKIKIARNITEENIKNGFKALDDIKILLNKEKE